jgi:hypothetical protein
MNATANLRAKLIELVQKKDLAALHILLTSYAGQWRHIQLIKLAIQTVNAAK